MRSIAIVGMLAAVTLAAPARAPVSWADWVGAYSGKLVWKACSAPGEPTATLVLGATDGAMAIDLAPAHAGLRAVSLVEGDAGWSALQGDLAVTVKRPRANTIDLTVELDSCTLKAQLRRAATTIPACDRLVGWARIEAACTKLGDGPSEDLAKLVATKWRKADAASCTARADKLERALVDAGCAPHPDPSIGVRAPDCVALAATTARLERCASVPAGAKQRFVALGRATVAAAQTAEPYELSVVEAECRDTRAMLISIGTRFGCPSR